MQAFAERWSGRIIDTRSVGLAARGSPDRLHAGRLPLDSLSRSFARLLSLRSMQGTEMTTSVEAIRCATTRTKVGSTRDFGHRLKETRTPTRMRLAGHGAVCEARGGRWHAARLESVRYRTEKAESIETSDVRPRPSGRGMPVTVTVEPW